MPGDRRSSVRFCLPFCRREKLCQGHDEARKMGRLVAFVFHDDLFPDTAGGIPDHDHGASKETAGKKRSEVPATETVAQAVPARSLPIDCHCNSLIVVYQTNN